MKPSNNSWHRGIRENGGKILNIFMWSLLPLHSRKSKVYERHGTFLENRTNLIIFHSYPKDLSSEKAAISLLREFETLNWQVVLVTNSRNSFKAAPRNFVVLRRKNTGSDLAGYRDALSIVCRNDLIYENIVLLNDSMKWEVDKLIANVISASEKVKVGEVMGFTNSMQTKEHLQTYFLTFKGATKVVFEIFTKIPNSKIKRLLVTCGEIRLSELFRKNGLQTRAVYEYSMLEANALDPANPHKLEAEILRLLQSKVFLNPTQHFWNVLYDLGHPGIKKSLIAKNPAHLKNVPLID
jgi:lipopolysaccharide biosynthesis protein